MICQLFTFGYIAKILFSDGKLRDAILYGRIEFDRCCFRMLLLGAFYLLLLKLRVTRFTSDRLNKLGLFPRVIWFFIDPESIVIEIEKCIGIARNGIHVVLVVVSLAGRFSLEEAYAIDTFRQFFAGKIGDYMILVFTNGDALWTILIDGYLALIDDYMARNCFEPFAETPQLCVNRHVIFDNSTYDEEQMNGFLEKVAIASEALASIGTETTASRTS
ncbi:hypothetical protein OROHE_007199 [Orobanche hederae]